MKKTILYPIVFIVILVASKLTIDYFDVEKSPEKLVTEFLSLYPDEKAMSFLSEEDQAVLKQSEYPIKSLIEIQYSEEQVTILSVVNISEKELKVDVKNKDMVLDFYITKKADDRWGIFLNLEKKYNILKEQDRLNSAELSEDENLILMSLKKLKVLEETSKYDERIYSIESLIEKKKIKNDYFKNLAVDDISMKNNFVSAFIRNSGNKNIKSVKGKIQLVSDSGEIHKEFDVSLFDYIPGSFVFGQPIPSNHQKKIGFDLGKLDILKFKVFISIVDFEFYEK